MSHTTVLLLLAGAVYANGFATTPLSGMLRRTVMPRGVCSRTPCRAGGLRMAAESEEGGLSDEDLAGLMGRVAKAKDNLDELPILIVDAMLPRQRLKFQAEDKPFVRQVMEEGVKEFGMLGVDPFRKQVCIYGSVVDVTDSSWLIEDITMNVEMVARKRFKLLGDPWQDPKGHHMCRVMYVDDEVDEELEEGGDAAQAIAKRVEEADAEANIQVAKELEGLVSQWKALVVETGREREPSQIENILKDLGEMPPVTSPRDRAMWVAALINPLPALGVSLEIRPAVLSSPSVSGCLQIAKEGIVTSIAHLDGTRPLW